MIGVLKKIKTKLFLNKYDAEADFWLDQINEYQLWYSGEKELWNCKPPSESQKIKDYDLKNNSILTWFNLHQKPKYLHDLAVDSNIFLGKKLLDIGAGPMPSAMVFEGTDLYCLDPLYWQYLLAGYPLHFYGSTKFINSFAESIPMSDHFFDAVISVNAIDHVDNLEKTSAEIKRVLKPFGKFAMHVHYHKSTKTEPLEINDEIFLSLFNWCPDLKRIKESRTKMGTTLTDNNEKYVLWRNF